MRVRRARLRGSDDRGATAVEYGLIVALIAVVIVVAVALVGGNLLDSFTNSNNAIDEAVTGGGATTTPLATWEQIGNSGNYHWQCLENNFDLGAAAHPVRSDEPSGTAPSCG